MGFGGGAGGETVGLGGTGRLTVGFGGIGGVGAGGGATVDSDGAIKGAAATVAASPRAPVRKMFLKCMIAVAQTADMIG